jgi:hypothetical protein
MRNLLSSILFLFSTVGLAQAEKKFLCDTTDISGTVELNIPYTAVIADQVAYLSVGTVTVSLIPLVINNKKTTIYLGEDTELLYAFYSKSSVLSLLKHDSRDAPYDFSCNLNL